MVGSLFTLSLILPLILSLILSLISSFILSVILSLILSYLISYLIIFFAPLTIIIVTSIPKALLDRWKQRGESDMKTKRWDFYYSVQLFPMILRTCLVLLFSCCHRILCLSDNPPRSHIFSLQNIAIVVSSDIRHAALQRQAKVLRMVSNTRIMGHNHRLVDRQETDTKNPQYWIFANKLSCYE